MIKKLITWLFEKYCLDDWTNQNQEREIDEYRNKYDLYGYSDEEIKEAMIDSERSRFNDAVNECVFSNYEKNRRSIIL